MGPATMYSRILATLAYQLESTCVSGNVTMCCAALEFRLSIRITSLRPIRPDALDEAEHQHA